MPDKHQTCVSLTVIGDSTATLPVQISASKRVVYIGPLSGKDKENQVKGVTMTHQGTHVVFPEKLKRRLRPKSSTSFEISELLLFFLTNGATLYSRFPCD